ncbi:hypothetical protein [Polycladidibacter stylochi]|uniref:hypothetical protein n=1 Tax=Polycladidibacter stylochi TaxID=1807766 RepID=UPI00082D3E64|nr:hypothetical protein [Pseudovibrio stylochi]
MYLKKDPALLCFNTVSAISYKEMLLLAQSIFAEFGREISSMDIIDFYDTPSVHGINNICEFIHSQKTAAPRFDCEKTFSFTTNLIEGLERDIGADSELSVDFTFNSITEQHISIEIRSHLFAKSAERTLQQFSACGAHIFKTVPKAAGFTILGVPWQFLGKYSAALMIFEADFPNISQDVYDKFEKELFWYFRLGRPVALMTEYGLFRNVYPYNFVCAAQLASLKMLFEYDSYPRLSPGEEDKINKHICSKGDTHRPKLPGQLIDLGSQAALWCVPEHEREMAFNVLLAADLTLYRFYIDHKDLFPKEHDS